MKETQEQCNLSEVKMIKVNILFFGALKSHFGNSVVKDFEKDISVNEIINYLASQKPQAKDILENCQYAIDTIIQPLTYKISKDTELAVLPPFSGG